MQLTANRIIGIIQLKKPYYMDGTVERLVTRLISFENFIMEEGTPIYVQIIQHIKRGIVAGTIRDGDEMPSRRALSALLGVNPNTVQKAYRLLEEAALIASHAGAKSCVVADAEKAAEIRTQLLENDSRSVINALKQMGLSKEEALSLIDRLWNEEGGTS